MTKLSVQLFKIPFIVLSPGSCSLNLLNSHLVQNINAQIMAGGGAGRKGQTRGDGSGKPAPHHAAAAAITSSQNVGNSLQLFAEERPKLGVDGSHVHSINVHDSKVHGTNVHGVTCTSASAEKRKWKMEECKRAFAYLGSS